MSILDPTLILSYYIIQFMNLQSIRCNKNFPPHTNYQELALLKNTSTPPHALGRYTCWYKHPNSLILQEQPPFIYLIHILSSCSTLLIKYLLYGCIIVLLKVSPFRFWNIPFRLSFIYSTYMKWYYRYLYSNHTPLLVTMYFALFPCSPPPIQDGLMIFWKVCMKWSFCGT